MADNVKECFMNNNDKQASVPFSPQVSTTELEEQALEGITGGGKFKNFIKSCFACGAPKVLSPTTSAITSFGHEETETSQPVTYSEYASPSQGSEIPSKLPRRSFPIDAIKAGVLPPIRTR
jgi:hypothetical protein